MVRIANINLPKEKNIAVALTYIYGIGDSRAREILQKLNINPYKKTSQLMDQEVNVISQEIKKFATEGELKRTEQEIIKEQISIACYRGIRRLRNVKVRGQSTRHNNRNRPTGGLNVLYKERVTIANKKKAPKQG